MFSPALVQLAGYFDKFHWPHKVVLTEVNCILCVAIRSINWTLIAITSIISTLVKRRKGEEGFHVTLRRLVGFPKARKFENPFFMANTCTLLIPVCKRIIYGTISTAY